MNLSTYQFPKVTEVDLAFSTFDAPKDLLQEALTRNLQKGCKKFSQLFFSGGEMNMQPDVEGTWKKDALLFAIALMRSFTPKHEHKELVCAMIFEECLIIED